MPKSPRTKMREYRARMSEEKKAEARARNNEQAKKYRASMSTERRTAERLDNTIRKRKARLRGKAMRSSSKPQTEFVFPTAQSEGKAVRKVISSLPKSPRRKIAVLKKLAIQHGIINKKEPSRRNLFQTEELSEAVKQFYESDDVSRQCPGKKEFVTVRTETGKQQVQKKVLVMTIMEAFQMFKEERPDIKIGKSKFANLRPSHVVPISEKDHNVCCCIYHENFELLLTGLKKYNKEIPNPDNLLALSMCKEKSTLCSLGDCKSCKDVSACVQSVMSLLPDQQSFSYYQWSQSKKEEVQTLTHMLKEELTRQVQTMRTHSFIAKVQLHNMKQFKISLNTPNTAILQEDFSENYCLKQQNEIMTAHWNQTGVTIFTAIAYFSNSDFASFAVVSDCLDHNKFAVATFNRTILQELQNSGKLVKNLHVFSDGCGGQFKNCSTLSLVTTPKLLHPELDNMDWSFFATSHGKGPIDGIGGTVKRAVWRRVLRENKVVNTAEEFTEVAKQACPKVNTIFVPKEVVAEFEDQLESFWSKNQPKTIKNTRSFHYFRRESATSISTAVISPFSGLDIEYKTFAIFKAPPCDQSLSTSVSQSEEEPSTSAAWNITQGEPEAIKVEHYYAVDYVDRFYIGRVLSQEQDDVWKIKFMHKTTVGGVSYFSWPDREDLEEVHRLNIFYGPVVLLGSLPFTIPDLEKINTAFALRS